MDIDLLSKMVKELILDNDKVVLPGLGAFVAETVPSTFSDKGYTINPPYRRLYFRSKPDEGDVLTVFYAKSNGLDAAVADKVIREFASELKSILYIKKTVVFPGLGRMRATKENAVFFVADEELDIYPEGLGLEPISLKTHQETKEEVTAAIVGLKAIVEEQSVQDPVAESEPVVAPEPLLEPDPATEPVSEVSSEPVSEVSSEPESEVAPEPEPEVAPEPVVADPEPVVVVEKKPASKLWKVLLWLVIIAALLLVAFVVVSRLYPQALDTLLYTPEELEILNR